MKNKINIFISGVLFLLIYSHLLRLFFLVVERIFFIKEVLIAVVSYVIIGSIIFLIGYKIILNFFQKKNYNLRDLLILLGLTLFVFFLRELADIKFLESKYLILIDELSVHERNKLFNVKSIIIFSYQFFLLAVLSIRANKINNTNVKNAE